MPEGLSHDILIVGGGAAGLRAAIAAVEVDANLDIAVVSKVFPMRSHTVSAEGGAAAVLREDDSLDLHGFDTVRGSDFLADQDVVETFIEKAPEELIQLEHWGCPWSRDIDGKISVRAFGGMSVKRTVYASDKTGFHMLHALFKPRSSTLRSGAMMSGLSALCSSKMENVWGLRHWILKRASSIP